MFARTCRLVVAVAIALAAVACGGSTPSNPSAERPLSYGVYGEYARDTNKLMKSGLNRRVFNKVESQAGSDIALNSDGAISLEPGVYRISGVSTITMQTTFAPPTIKNDNV